MNLLLLEAHEIDSEGRARLSGRRAVHAREVLRAQAGDRFTVGIRGGAIGSGVVTASTADALELSVTAKDPPPARPGIDVILAIPRPKALKRVIPALASLGIDRIILINAARVEKSYFDAKVLAAEVLRSHIDLGLEQGKDTIPPTIEIQKRFKPFVEDELDTWAGAADRLVLHPGVQNSSPPRSKRVVIAVGPDGGWVPFEVELLQAHGFQVYALGPRPLRVEVAVPAIIGALGR
jgi:RsmE family RNA methyltransferase